MKKAKFTATPISDSLSGPSTFVDNELVDALEKISIVSKLGLSKRSGCALPQIVFALLIWPLLRTKSLACFCGRFIGCYVQGGKNVLYDFLGRIDINWDGVSLKVAKEVYAQAAFSETEKLAFVCDDTLKKRRGKKVVATSIHYDHNEGRSVKGHQVLQLGISGPKGFIPIEQQIYTGSKQVVEIDKPFADKRRAVVKDYWRALLDDKNEMLRQMLSKAIGYGFRAKWFLADAWFGNKANIKAVIDCALVGIFQMKKGKLKYRLNGRNYSATELYALNKRRMKAAKGQRFCTCELIVELNLHENNNETENWVKVKLVFSRPVASRTGNWVLFLCTDSKCNSQEILCTYSLRWSVEVYFKEIKQNMGFLQEQSGRYPVHYASVNLSAIRYLLFFQIMLDKGNLKYGQVRDTVSKRIEMLTFAGMLWEIFRALICGVLKQFCDKIGAPVVAHIMDTIDDSIQAFLVEALQMNEAYINNQNKAEKIGAL